MNWKKYKALVFGGSALLVLIVVAAVLLFKFRGEYKDTQKKLKRVVSDVRSLNEEPIYPSEANAKLLAKKKEELATFLADYRSRLSEGQIEPSAETRDTYLEYMRGILNSIYKQNPRVRILTVEQGATEAAPGVVPLAPSTNQVAEVHQVKVAEGFNFDFPSYYDGLRPQTNHIARLTIQLQTIKRLCEVLYEAEIDELVRIDREEFDGEGAPAAEEELPEEERALARDDDRPRSKSKDHLFSREKVEVEFLAHEAAVWRAIELLAQDAANFEITSVHFANQHDTIQPKAEDKKKKSTRPTRNTRRPLRPTRGPAAPTTSETTDVNDMERRQAAGNEKILVTLEVSAYRFNPTGETAAKAGDDS